jgi:hypothetical protein
MRSAKLTIQETVTLKTVLNSFERFAAGGGHRMRRIRFTDFEAFWFNRFLDRGLIGVRKAPFERAGLSGKNGYDIAFVKYEIDQGIELILTNAIADDPDCLFVEPMGLVEKYSKDLDLYDRFLNLLVKEQERRRIVIWTYLLSDDIDLLPRRFLAPCRERKLEIVLKYDSRRVFEIIRSRPEGDQE